MTLLIALFLLLALSALAAGMLWIAGAQGLITAAGTRHVRLRLAAEAAAMDAFAAWRTPRPGHAVGDAWTVRETGSPEHGTVVWADRLTPTLTLLRATATGAEPGGLTAVARVGLLIRTIQPEELLRAFPGALAARSANLGADAAVDADSADAPPDGWFAADCPPQADRALDSIFGGAVPGVVVPTVANLRQAPSARVRGQPPSLEEPALATGRAALGPLAWDLIPGIADGTMAGPPDSIPAPAGEPAGAPGQWRLLYAPHGVVMDGTTGQGVLVAGGDVTLRHGARFFGVVVTSGSLIMRDSARLVGAVRATSADIAGATVRYRACALWRAVAGAEALRRPFRPAGRWWLPDFAGPP
ncbi:MAG TPA: hypothetical protein VJ957_11490 [Longimicrobiales bacterium]|nr:hypothetical protein [Longimicrobiales bacterium]